MSDLNSINFTGNLGGDAETKDINGELKARYRVGISGRGKDETTWVTCEHWGPHQNLLPLLTKGKKVAVSGKLEEHGWVGADGKPRTAMVVRVYSLNLIGPKEQPAERPPSVVQGAGRRPKWEDNDQTPF
jgi:single-strand DNA-binding protein